MSHLFLLNAGLFLFWPSEMLWDTCVSEYLHKDSNLEVSSNWGGFEYFFHKLTHHTYLDGHLGQSGTRYRPQFYKVGLLPSPPPQGGFVFTMFPHQEPCVRGPPSKNLVQILPGGSSYLRPLIREHSKYKTPPGGGGSIDQLDPYITIPQYWFNKTKQHTQVEGEDPATPWCLREVRVRWCVGDFQSCLRSPLARSWRNPRTVHWFPYIGLIQQGNTHKLRLTSWLVPLPLAPLQITW